MIPIAHDPGGKTRLKLPADVRGAATFSACGRYRHSLSRDWTAPGEAPRTILFVGLNPSVADADASDPTCHRELTFARAWGYTRYLKANLLDWRATAPRDIPADPAIACSARNPRFLADLAAEAHTLVLASGNVHPRYAEVETRTLTLLRATGKPLMCLGKNKTGAARHPLYLRKDTQLEPFDAP